MKLRFFGEADSNQIATAESEYAARCLGNTNLLRRPSLKLRLARTLAWSRLIIRILLNGYRPKIRQGRDRDNKIYWYAYYPLSGDSKVLASEAEIQQWLELTEEF
jgi:hypothetical protein